MKSIENSQSWKSEENFMLCKSKNMWNFNASGNAGYAAAKINTYSQFLQIKFCRNRSKINPW